MKVYRVQDLASSGRKITVDGIDVQFDGHYAVNVPESIIYWFNRMDEFQVYQPTEIPDVVTPTKEEGFVPAISTDPHVAVTSPYAEEQKEAETKGEPTVSPNLAEVTKPVVEVKTEQPKVETPKVEQSVTTQPEIVKPRDDTPKIETVKVAPVEVVKPRTAQVNS